MLILFSTEPIFGQGYLEWLSGVLTQNINSTNGEGEVKILKVVTDPFVYLIVRVRNYCIMFSKLAWKRTFAILLCFNCEMHFAYSVENNIYGAFFKSCFLARLQSAGRLGQQ